MLHVVKYVTGVFMTKDGSIDRERLRLAVHNLLTSENSKYLTPTLREEMVKFLEDSGVYVRPENRS
jgi:hypothetical protein